MSETTNLGRVAMVPKGTWDNTATYSKLNVVTYGGSSYVARRDCGVQYFLLATDRREREHRRYCADGEYFQPDNGLCRWRLLHI